MVNQDLGTFEAKDNKIGKYLERLRKKSLKFTNFEIKQVAKNKNGHSNALAILDFVWEANRTQVVSVMIMTKDNLEEAEKIFRSIDAATSS